MIFDTHAHLISPDTARYPYAPLSGKVDVSVLENPVTAERLLEMMDTGGVKRAIAVQRAHVYGTDNRYVIDAAAAYPERLSALVILNPLAGEGAAEVRRWMGEGKAVGVRLTAPSEGGNIDWLNGAVACTVWKTVADLGGSMRVHLYNWNRDLGLPAATRLAADFPDMSVVIDHLSNLSASNQPPDYGVDDALKRLAERRNVSLMFSTINIVKTEAAGAQIAPIVKRIVEIFGNDRLVWGSDIAQSKKPYPDMIASARNALSLLDERQQKRVLHDNAARIYSR